MHIRPAARAAFPRKDALSHLAVGEITECRNGEDNLGICEAESCSVYAGFPEMLVTKNNVWTSVSTPSIRLTW